jgi:hypothetical protein
MRASGPNCFNAVQLYWDDCEHAVFLGPEEFVAYVQSTFEQVPVTDVLAPGDITIVWSRSSDVLGLGEIQIEDLRKTREGYPFGLVIEHAFVQFDHETVFQKLDPTPGSPYQWIPEEEALEPYINTHGFEITRHRRRK